MASDPSGTGDAGSPRDGHPDQTPFSRAEPAHSGAHPPPLPATPAPGSSGSSQTSPDGEEGRADDIPSTLRRQRRLHPLSLVFVVWNLARGFIIPLIIVVALGRESFLGGFILLFLIIPLVMGVVRYFTFTYRLEAGELITRQGVFSRTERNVPLTRVQDVRIEQGMLHRLLGMADVHLDTAGGQGAEASLSVLSLPEGEHLRAAVFQHKRAQSSQQGVPDPQGLAQSRSPDAEEAETVRKVGIGELAWAGMTSNHLATALAILAVVAGFARELIPEGSQERYLMDVTQRAGEWFEQGGIKAFTVVAGGVAGMLLVGMVFSVTSNIVLFYKFTLSRAGEDLHRAYGLFTRRSSSLPRRRIQVLKIEEKLVRRWFHLATLRADTAGGSSGEQGESRQGRDVLVPIMRREQVEPLLPVFFPDLNPESAGWKKVSRKAISRGTFKGSVVCLLWALLLVVTRKDWYALWPLGLIPLVYWTSLMSYRHLGYWLGDRYFRSRRGWLSRAGYVVPIRNAQCVVLRQNPFDRRHGVCTLSVDTAGQAYTGGGPSISNVPQEEAQAVGWTLARRAARTRYRW